MAQIVVVGSSNTDMTVRLPTLPSTGETVLGDAFHVSRGGKGANQAVAARRAGADVLFVTAVGDDDLGRRAVQAYQTEGIDVSHIRKIEGASSGVALIFVDRNGDNMIGVAPGANQLLTPNDIHALPGSVFSPEKVLLVGLEVSLETALCALERGRSAGMRTLLNPAPAVHDRPEKIRRLLASADLITPNLGEAHALAGIPRDAESNLDLCVRSLLALGPKDVLVTLGARGCLVAGADGAREFLAAPKVSAVDTVGAGDTFNGALAVALSEGKPSVEAARWACIAAALAVTKAGAQEASPTREEIERFISN